MADKKTATRAPKSDVPTGPQQLVIVDGIDLGERLQKFEGKDPYVAESYVYVFQTGALDPLTGKPFELSREFSVALGKNANLRKFLGQCAGRQLTEDEARSVELHTLEGFNVIGTVELSASGYANVSTVMPLMAGMAPIAARHYTRAPYWKDKRAEYAKEVDAYKAQIAAVAAATATPGGFMGGAFAAPAPAEAPTMASPSFPFAAVPPVAVAADHAAAFAAVAAAEDASQTIAAPAVAAPVQSLPF